jgi:hypothetical protein
VVFRCLRLRPLQTAEGILPRYRLALAIALGDLLTLASIEYRLSAELLALGLGAGNAGLAALADQLPLKLRYAAHDGHEQLALPGCSRNHANPNLVTSPT